MNKSNRIIVLVDFSDYTENLIDFAFSFSKIINARVIFVHQIVGLIPAMADQEIRNEIIKVKKQEAYANLRDLAKGRVNGEDAFQVSQDPVLSILEGLLADNYFDWIFAGLKGTGKLKRFFLSSTPLSIIDNSSFLTVAVPVRDQVPVPQKLLVGVTSQYELNKSQFDKVLFAFKDQIDKLEFFTIIYGDEDEGKAKDYLLDLQTEYISHKPQIQLYKGNNAFNLLKDQVKNSEDSFLVLQQGSRTLSDKLFRSFMIHELVYDAQTPLLVISK